MKLRYGRLLALPLMLGWVMPALAQSTYTMPSATDTVVGRDSTDTLRNKTIDCTTNICTNYPRSVTFGWIAGADVATYPSVIYTAEGAATVLAIRGRVSNPAGGSAVLNVFKAPAGTACGSGTNQVTSWSSGSGGTGFDANNTAASVATATLAGGAANVLATGDSLCAVGTGSFSTLAASGAISIRLQVQ